MLPKKKYSVIYADPLLDFRKRNLEKRDGYPVGNFNDLKDVDVSSIAKTNSVLLMWVEGSTLTRALELIKAWGFTYRRVSFILHSNDNLKKSPRLCLFATKGDPKATKINNVCPVFDRAIVSEIGVGDIIRSYFDKAPAIKLLFEESSVKGWSSWGSWKLK